MRISSDIKLGILFMEHLVQAYDTQKWIQLAPFSHTYQLPLKFLEKIARNLKIAGLVTSKRGSRGGYALSKSPENITLFEFISALDGNLKPAKCSPDQYRCCLINSTCSHMRLWYLIEKPFHERLQSISLLDFCQYEPEQQILLHLNKTHGES